MAESDRTAPDTVDAPLPDDSVLSLDEYLAMQRAVGNEIRFRILDLLLRTGSRKAKEIGNTLDVPSNTLHYHLDELVGVGLVENRKRKEPERSGLYSYYRATSLGRTILERGVRELMSEEWELLDAYGR